MATREIIRQAKRKVRSKKRFYWHLAIFSVVSALLFLINIANSDSDGPWFLIPTIPWAIVIFFHYLGVFKLNSDWEKEQLEKEILRLEERRQLLLEDSDEILDINEKDYLKLEEWEERKRSYRE